MLKYIYIYIYIKNKNNTQPLNMAAKLLPGNQYFRTAQVGRKVISINK